VIAGRLRRGLFRLDRRHRQLASLVAFAVLLVICVLALLPFRADENVGAIALTMLLPPLAATGAGPVAAGAAALVSGLVFNFFFTHPYHSPKISSTASVAAFIVYLVIALAGAVIVARLRSARALADRRAADATLLQALTIELIQNAEASVTLRSALVQLTDALGLRGVCLLTVEGPEQIVAEAGQADEAVRTARQLLDRGRGSAGRVVALREPGKPAAFPITTIDTAFGFVVADPGPTSLGIDRERFLESFTGVVALALTRARLGEERLRRRALEETDHLRTVLLQSVSHDLRTPLTAIKATASSLRTDALSPEHRDEMLAAMEQEVDRLSHFIANLLDLSRIESGALRLDRHPVPLDDLVDDAIAAAGPFVAPDRVEVDLPEDLVVLDADETLLRQVLVNLLQNAARYASGSGPFRVEASPRDGDLEVRVVDHGPGVPEPERMRIFEPYNRARPGLRGRGSGLGLAISRGFVAAHGGTLAIETTPGGGATFVVTLPLTRQEAHLGP
jgi:two-component system sensor histidine kinase KdpD